MKPSVSLSTEDVAALDACQESGPAVAVGGLRRTA